VSLTHLGLCKFVQELSTIDVHSHLLILSTNQKLTVALPRQVAQRHGADIVPENLSNRDGVCHENVWGEFSVGTRVGCVLEKYEKRERAGVHVRRGSCAFACAHMGTAARCFFSAWQLLGSTR
jgi:hypothetical protein